MHYRILTFIEPLFAFVFNTTFLIAWFNPFSITLFIIGLFWQISRLKREIETHHQGSIITWIKWLKSIRKKN